MMDLLTALRVRVCVCVFFGFIVGADCWLLIQMSKIEISKTI